MQTLYRTRFWVIFVVLLIFLGVNKNSIAGDNKDCWNLVSVKATWKKKDSNGKWVSVSPNGIKSHLSTDGSWQWVEYDDPRFSNGRVFVNAGWSPPPKQYCYPGEGIKVSLKLTNKLINKKIRGNVAQMSWGNNHYGGYGNGRASVSVAGFEPGTSSNGNIRMHNGQKSLNQPATWMASIQIGNMRGQVDYHYLPMSTKGKEKTKSAATNSQVNTPPSRNTNTVFLNANNDMFVRSLYYAILNRKPDEAGVKNWTQSLVSGKSRAWVITGFFKSSEYLNKRKNNTEYVRDLYRGVLGRQPDPGGLSHWVNLLNSGNSRHSVLNGFLNSTEYKSRASRG